VIVGVASGLLAALCQSVCYLYSRRYVTRPGHSSLELFALSHVWMAGLSLVLLPLVWSPQVPAIRQWLWPLACCAVFYLTGQMALFTALRSTDASRVSPLLGLKILMLALIAAACLPVAALRDLLLLRPVTPLQWLSVGACVAAALMLNEAGGRMPTAGLLCTIAACLAYSLSDLSIGVLVERLRGMGPLRSAIYGCVACYAVTGLAGLAALGGRPLPEWPKWKLALPVAGSWMLAMFFLFATFKFAGVLFGNILQSTRGLISIGLAAWLAHAQLAPRLETRVAREVFWRRLAAAALMFLGIAAFLVSRL
jgi:drug/metabolite transporter (DMT)-like permease